MEPMKPMPPMKPMAPMGHGEKADAWWPADLGDPGATGSANALRYAYFAAKHRLAVDDGKGVTVYDTGGKRIHGFHSSGASGLGFETDDGKAGLESLKAV